MVNFWNLSLRLFVALTLFIATIELVSYHFAMPSVLDILNRGAPYFLSFSFIQDLIVTTSRWMVGWVIGFVLGILTGVLTGRSKTAAFTLEGFFTLLRAIPFICIVPLSVRFFGFDEVGKWFTVGWAVFFVTWIGAHVSSKQVPEDMVWRAKSLGMSAVQWLRFGILSYLKPTIYSLGRTTLLIGLVVTAVSELAGAYDRSSGIFWSEGLGYRIFRSLNQGDDGLLLFSIACFSFLGVFADKLFIGLFDALNNLIKRRRIESTRNELNLIAEEQTATFMDSVTQAPVIKVQDLSVSFGTEEVLNNLNLTINSGEVLAILGKSGEGKSTLLKAIAGQLPHDVKLSGQVSFELNGSRVKPSITSMHQKPVLFNDFTVWQNAKLSFRKASIENLLTVRKALEKFGLLENADQLAGTLSGGQAQRLTFVASYLTSFNIILYDEPFAALDAITKREVQAFYVNKIKPSRVSSSVWVTHSVEEALIVADKILIGLNNDAKIVNNENSTKQGWLDSTDFIRKKHFILQELERTKNHH